VPSQFVHFIQHDDTIRRAALLDGLKDEAGKGANVGAAVAADLSLGVDAADCRGQGWGAIRVLEGGGRRERKEGNKGGVKLSLGSDAADCRGQGWGAIRMLEGGGRRERKEGNTGE
jgi:hypothetical protein